MIAQIKLLSHRADYISREELIEIADYIQLKIVDGGKISEHPPLINAILSTGMSSFAYPKIASLLEKDVNRLVKTHAMSHMDLAPIYHTLWSLTLKPRYLNLFEQTVRHAYFALAKGKTYPNLWIDRNNPQSISSVIKFLEDNRKTLWVLNDKYNVDEVILKSKVAL